MPITIKSAKIAVKSPGSSEYTILDVLADQTAEQVISEINAAGATTISQVTQAVEDSQDAVDELEAQKNTIAQTVAFMAQLGTDTTLSTSGMAADAKATGDEITELKSAIDYNYVPISISGLVESGGVKGSIGNIITITSTNGYRHLVIDVPSSQVRIKTYETSTATYPYYVYGTDENDIIIMTSAESEYIAVHEVTHVISIPSNVTKLYIMCTASTDALFYERVSVEAYKPENVSQRITDLDEKLDVLHAGEPHQELNPELQEQGWTAVMNAISELNNYDVLFTVITDSHITGYEGINTVYQDSFKLNNRVNALPCIDFCANLGDLITVDGTTTKSDAIKQIETALNQLDCRKMYFCIGNHDKNAKHVDSQGNVDYTEVLLPNELYNVMLKRNDVVIDTTAAACEYKGNYYNNVGTYYYFDIPRSKIRCAFLNSYDTAGEHPGFETLEQATFLNTKVFADDGYSVMLFSHNFTLSTLSARILNVIKNHSDRIIGLFSGHRHSDINDETILDNNDNIIPYHVFNSTYRRASQVGTDKLTVSIVGVRTVDKTVTMKRIGLNAGTADWSYVYGG